MAQAAEQIPSEWVTNIIDPSIKRIFALSDIHGDMHALIIALRDCAKVIRKKQEPGIAQTNPEQLDMETEKLLEMDLNNPVKTYVDDLNYEWCDNNKHVVICGDILDGFRAIDTNFRSGNNGSICPSDTDGNTTGCTANEYPQIEIKIFRFINALNSQPNINCKIHKVLGNHELWNMVDDKSIESIVKNYIPPFTIKLGDEYHNGISRLAYFKYGNPGFNLILEGGAGIFLKINNNIFVHGQLDHALSYEEYDYYNTQLNRRLNEETMDKLLYRFAINGDLKKTLSGREYDRNFLITDTYPNDYNNDQYKKCKAVKKHLEVFLKKIPLNTYNPDQIRIIVGHCPQNFYKKILNSSFTDYKLKGNVEILSGHVRTSFKNPDENFIFGIGMECDKTHLDKEYNGFEGWFHNQVNIAQERDPPESVVEDFKMIDNNERYIYKVDVGVSRGFDTINKMYQTQLEEKEELGARVPQVLEIGSKNIKIIRSTIKNMRIHQPREVYENNIIQNNYAELYKEDPYYNSHMVASSAEPSLLPKSSKPTIKEMEAKHQELLKMLNTTPEEYKEAYKIVKTTIKITDYETREEYTTELNKLIKEYIDSKKTKMKYIKYKLKYLQLKKNIN
jgi:hypothetical protein